MWFKECYVKIDANCFCNKEWSKALMACDRATTRQSDAVDCRTDEFLGHVHVKSIGMDHGRCAGDHCHVTLPKQQIAGLVRLICDVAA